MSADNAATNVATDRIAAVTDYIRARVLEAGASRCGFARIEPVEPDTRQAYRQWIDRGMHGSMQYLGRYDDVRFDPAMLLDGAKTLISCAFTYYTYTPTAMPIARYALGEDYHNVLRRRLKAAGRDIVAHYGGDFRVCVDTAPILERYWAQRAGVGFIGLNHQLIVPGIGSYVFLAELLWTGETLADRPLDMHCQGCRSCIKACPGGALHSENGSFDARRCISYLTIEHRGPLPEGSTLHGCVYGCDRCQQVCPHNAHIHPDSPIPFKSSDPEHNILPEFTPNPEIAALIPDKILEMTEERYSQIFAHSAMRRCPLPDLRRNILTAIKGQSKQERYHK